MDSHLKGYNRLRQSDAGVGIQWQLAVGLPAKLLVITRACLAILIPG